MRKLLSIATIAVFMVGTGAVQASSITEAFDTAPTGWVTDRYAPAGFNAPVSFMGDSRLALSISASDGQNNRSSPYASSFYNTQGMQHDDPSGTIFNSIDLYLSLADLSSTNRIFGLWGTARDTGGSITGWPVLEFANGQFRGWSNAGWTDYGLPSFISGDEWVTLAFALNLAGDKIGYFVNGVLLGMVDADGAQYIANTILQGYNTEDGVSYTAYLDNLVMATPLPAALPLMGTALLGFAGFAGWRRKREKSSNKAAA